MKISQRSYMQPTPKNWRKFGDGLLAAGGALTAANIANGNEILAYISLAVMVFGKFLTNFFTE